MKIDSLVMHTSQRGLPKDEWEVWQKIVTIPRGARITQQQILKMCPWLGAHSRFDKVVSEDTTLRRVRQIIRNLRLDHGAPILSDHGGYFIPQNEIDVQRYLERLEKVAKAQTAAWFETYKAMKATFEVTSTLFEKPEGLFAL